MRMKPSLAGRCQAKTALANALRFWDDNEPISNDAGNLRGEVQLEMPDEGMIEVAEGCIELEIRAAQLQ